MIAGALNLKSKTAGEVMINLDHVFMLDVNSVLGE